MPGLYQISSNNANVAVTNTTGLYIGNGASSILNNAALLLTLLDNNGNVNFALDPATSNTTIYSYFVGTVGSSYSNANVAAYLPINSANVAANYFIGDGSLITNLPIGPSSYGNANVAAYLPIYTGSLALSSTIIDLYSNAASQQTSINTINANLGAFEIYANATFGTSSYGNANVAAYLPTNSSNVAGNYFLGNGSKLTGLTGAAAGVYGSDVLIPSITVDATGRITGITTNAVSGGGSYGNANVAAYLPTYTGSLAQSSTIVTLNANVGTLFLGNASTNANLGAYQIYANANAASQQTSIDTINANLGSYQTYANANAASQATSINTINANLGAFETYANATFGTSNYSNVNVAAYLPTYTGSLALSSTIVDLYSNAATQAASINTINANLGAFQTYSNATNAATQANIGTLFLGNASTNANLGAYQTWANSYFGTSNYSNVNVAAYLPTYTGSLALSSTIVDLYSNAATQATSINTINANLGAYQTYANANVSNLQNQITGANTNITTNTNSINTINANLGAYQTYANANAATQATSINTINANLGAFQTYANTTFVTTSNQYSNVNVAAYLATNTDPTISSLNANAAVQAVSINNINANLGAFQTYSNTTNAATQANIGTLFLGNASTNANLGAYQTYANANAASQATSINTINANLGAFQTYANNTFSTSTYANANVASYLPTYFGNIGEYAGNAAITLTTSNTTVQNHWVNISAISSTTAYANVFSPGPADPEWAGPGVINLTAGTQTFVTGGKINFTATDYNFAGYKDIFEYPAATLRFNDGVITSNNGGIISTKGNLIVSGSTDINWVPSTTANTYDYTNAGGYIISNNIFTVSNVSSNRFVSNTGYFWSNGTAYSTGGGGGSYGNVDVAAYLPTYTGSIATNNLTSANVTFNGNINTGWDIFASNITAAGTFTGDGSGLTGISASPYGTYTGGGIIENDDFQAVIGPVVALTTLNDFSGPLIGISANTANPGILLGSTTFNLGGDPAVYFPTTSTNGILVPAIKEDFQPDSLTQGYDIYQQAGWGNVYVVTTDGTNPSSIYQFSNVGLQFPDGTVQSTAGGGSGYGNTQVGQYLTSGATAIQANLNKVTSSTGFFWANGTAYSTGGGGGGSDFTSNLTVNGNYIINANLSIIREKFANIGTLNGTTTIDANTAIIQAAAVASNITINTNNITNLGVGQTITLKLTQVTNANLRILTSNILFAGGSKTLSTANAAIDTLSITYDGENYLGALVKGYS